MKSFERVISWRMENGIEDVFEEGRLAREKVEKHRECWVSREGGREGGTGRKHDQSRELIHAPSLPPSFAPTPTADGVLFHEG